MPSLLGRDLTRRVTNKTKTTGFAEQVFVPLEGKILSSNASVKVKVSSGITTVDSSSACLRIRRRDEGFKFVVDDR